ncbi:MAG: hypothetical protein Q7W02_01970 [Candidatus Rokubacteria bacterium]|nr:hypothetical protein [Candidatus Rokubacteria bacterium]
MFSGGDYDEVARWLENFAISHAKREDLRAECALDTESPREGTSYGLRVKVGDHLSSEIALGFDDVAAGRGSMAWCRSLADRVRGLVSEATRDSSLRPA